MAETSENPTGNGTSAVIESAPVNSPNMEGETEQPITRTVVTTDKIQLKAKRGRPPGTSKFNVRASDPCVALINSINGDSRYEVSARRRAPDLKEIGNAIPQGPVSSIKEFLEQTHGSGVYTLTVTDDGVIIPREQGGSTEIRINPKPVEVEDTDDLKAVKVQTQKINEQKKQAEAQRELERARREMKEEAEEAERKAKELEASPVVAEIAELKEQLKELAKPKPSEWTIEKIAVLITAAAPLIQLFVPKKDDSIEKVLQTINESNKQTTERLMKLLEAKSEKSRDELSTLDIYMKVKKELREENNEFQKRMSELMPRTGDDDIDIDPNNIWGSLAAAGVKGIIHLFKTGGPGMVEAIQTIAANVGKKPEQLTDADTAAVQAAIATAQAEQRQQPRPLPAPPQAQQRPPMQRAPLGPPRPLQIPQIDPARPTPILKNVAVPSELPGALAVPNTLAAGAPVAGERPKDEAFPAELPQATNATFPNDVTAPIVGASATGSPEGVHSVALFKLSTPELEEDLRLEIDKSIQDMIQDVGSGRVIRGSLVWVDEALDRWNLDFLKHLATLSNHMDRHKLVLSKASLDSRRLLNEALQAEDKKLDATPDERKYLWNNFFNSFEVLIRAFAERQKETKA